VPDHGDLETKELYVAMKAYSPEFKADAVALYLSDPSRTYASVAKDLGVNRETLRLWVREARSAGTAPRKAAPANKRPAGPLASDDVLEEENKQLRARIRELELERDILRRAAKYFAGETNW
jgi:transposase